MKWRQRECRWIQSILFSRVRREEEYGEEKVIPEKKRERDEEEKKREVESPEILSFFSSFTRMNTERREREA